jgi:hypothetical protein
VGEVLSGSLTVAALFSAVPERARCTFFVYRRCNAQRSGKSLRKVRFYWEI